MSKITITRTKNTVSATYLPYTAYKAAISLATEYKGEIGTTDKGNFKATFNSVETAKNFVTVWTANYEANRKVDLAPTKAPTPTQKSSTSKPTATKGKAEAKTPSTRKPKANAPKKAKGNGFNFDEVKGATKSEKNRALHAMLVAKGIKDSRTPEYQAVWNARPWAK